MEEVPHPIPSNLARFMSRLRVFIRIKYLSYQTEKTYCYWVAYFILFNNKQHPEALGATHVDEFLNFLSINRDVSPNTQKTALNSLAFLYNQFLKKPLGDLAFKHSNKERRVPTVFSQNEAKAVLDNLEGTIFLAAALMYSSGLRVMESLRLRLQDAVSSNNRNLSFSE